MIVAIAGVGLIGGSLGKALRGRARVIALARSASKAKTLQRLRVADEVVLDWAPAVRRADVVVVAAPVDKVLPVVRKLLPDFKPGALVMDVSSVKEAVLLSLKKEFQKRPDVFFVGAHPMAGSEKTGAAHAHPGMFRGAVCVLTPEPKTPRRVLTRAESFWKSVGAKPLVLSSRRHDDLAANTSHLMHLLASALSAHVAQVNAKDRMAGRLLAGSFRDMTRVAMADPEQWSPIFLYNRRALQNAIGSWQKIFRRYLQALNDPRRLSQLLRSAGNARRRLMP